jgi:hypothetical protein
MDQDSLFEVVTVTGVDALAFLQSQFAAELNALVDGELRWAALLNARGRVLFVVAAWREAVDRWRLLVPFARAGELVELLRRFVFRRKVTMAVDAGVDVVAAKDGVACGVADVRLALAPRGAGTALGVGFVDRCVDAGLVLIAAAASGRHLAHALRLDRFEAFSVKKGCYPGQEIVARTHFLGRNKRVLCRLDGIEGAGLDVATPLHHDNQDVGETAMLGRRGALAVLTAPLPVGTGLRAGADGPIVTVAATAADGA